MFEAHVVGYTVFGIAVGMMISWALVTADRKRR